MCCPITQSLTVHACITQPVVVGAVWCWCNKHLSHAMPHTFMTFKETGTGSTHSCCSVVCYFCRVVPPCMRGKLPVQIRMQLMHVAFPLRSHLQAQHDRGSLSPLMHARYLLEANATGIIVGHHQAWCDIDARSAGDGGRPLATPACSGAEASVAVGPRGERMPQLHMRSRGHAAMQRAVQVTARPGARHCAGGALRRGRATPPPVVHLARRHLAQPAHEPQPAQSKGAARSWLAPVAVSTRARRLSALPERPSLLPCSPR